MRDPLRVGPSPIHGLGVFANVGLGRGARVIEYLGEKITKEESALRRERQNYCIFSLDDEFDLDGDFVWNPARLVNHSCAPNCEAECVNGRIWITALRDIPPGEEITFNYGYDWEAYEEHPCRCGAAECVGFIVAGEFFGQLRRRKIFESLPPDRGQPTAPAPHHTNPGAGG
ncbi:MAG: SET domain-containing protein [Limisphaerales bacterium]